jgi:transposase-like protein
MIQIVKCEYCDDDNIPINGISVDLTFMKHRYCKECHQSHTEKKTYFFCSTQCFDLYMKTKKITVVW